jgi:hypothetical protein
MVSLASGLLRVPYLISMLIKFSSAISRVSSLKTDTADSPRLIILCMMLMCQTKKLSCTYNYITKALYDVVTCTSTSHKG